MKHKNNTGFALLSIVVVILSIAIVTLAAVGFMQASSAKKLFTKPDASMNMSMAQSSSSSDSLSSSDKSLVDVNLDLLQTSLEAYFATNNSYPSSLTDSAFTTQPGASSPNALRDASSTPKGVTYNYQVLPDGCSTAAKTCQHFFLLAQDSKGSPIGLQVTSMN